MVLDYFKQLSSIPRGSGNNTAISNFFVDFAKKHNLRYIQDEHENVVIFKDGSKGYEDCTPLIIQGHMDMVCEKTADSNHDFLKDGLKLYTTDDGYMSAENTTLGADNGIALAYMMELLTDDSISHPPYEMVITTDEEIGMVGALAFDASCLKGKHMLNLDSEEEGIFTAACAGGLTGEFEIPIKRETKEGIKVDLVVSGLKGGHSGIDIDKNRTNATIILGRVLAYLLKDDFYILDMAGGSKDNVITNEAAISFVVKFDKTKEFVDKLVDITSMIMDELSSSEPDMEFSIEENETSEPWAFEVLDDDGFSKIFYFLNFVPNGVHVMSTDIPGMVESSSNLGIFKTDTDCISASIAMRSQKKSYIQFLSMKLAGIAAMLGAKYGTRGGYPGWDLRPESPFRDMLCRVYKETTGKDVIVNSIHAGLESGVFTDKIPEIDIVSTGPNIKHIHTVNEKMELESVERTYEFVKKAVEEFARLYGK